MADDLQRYLDDKPILAKRPSMVERTRKWSRRHPSVVVAGMLILVVCVVGLLASNWMIALEQAKTQEALQHEKDRAMEARRAVGDLVEIAGSELADQPHLEGVRKRLLRTALAYYRDFIETHGTDPAAQADLENGKKRAGKLLEELSTLEGKNLLGWATNPEVQDDLGIREDQRANLAKLKDEFFALRMKNFRWDTPEGRRTQYESTKKQEVALKGILESKQLERLQQIDLQAQGPKAFHDSDAVEALKLSPEQMSKIRGFKNEALQEMFAPRDSPKDMRLEMDAIKKAEVGKIIGILTPEQKAQWQALTGQPFAGSLHMPPPPHGGDHHRDGPPPGGRRGGPQRPPP